MLQGLEQTTTRNIHLEGDTHRGEFSKLVITANAWIKLKMQRATVIKRNALKSYVRVFARVQGLKYSLEGKKL